jgi:hypothetical protein
MAGSSGRATCCFNIAATSCSSSPPASPSPPHTDAGGPHALGSAVVSWHATKDVFVALDAAYIDSASFSARAGSLNRSFTFRGPLVRLAVGLH